MNEIKTGYQPSGQRPAERQFGAADIAINPGGHWLPFIPSEDTQQNVGIETESCTCEAATHAVETLNNFLYKDTTIWSPRFLAFVSGTGTKHGNDPWTVATTIEKVGLVPETDWAHTADLDTWDKYYAVPPQALYIKALEFTAEYNLTPKWVQTDKASLLAALESSPVVVAGFAWAQDTTGLYYTPDNTSPCHDFVLVDYYLDATQPNGITWIVRDSYDNEIKHLRGDYVFSDAVVYTISYEIVNPSAWTQFLSWMNIVLQQMFKFGEYNPDRLGGSARSPEWTKVRAAHLVKEPTCRVCGGTSKITVHHILPFHIDKSLELQDSNLITLCEGNKTINCHLRYGHFDNFRTKWNPDIKTEAALWLRRFTAKDETGV